MSEVPKINLAQFHMTIIISSLGCGGAENTAAKLANYFSNKGYLYQVSVITLNQDVEDFFSLDPKINRVQLNLKKDSKNLLQSIKNNFYRICKIRKTLQTIKPDVVISFMDQTSILCLLAAMNLEIPIFLSEQNAPDRPTISKLWKLLRRFVYPKAYTLVVQNQGIKKACASSKLNRRIKVIPNPIIIDHRVKEWHKPPAVTNFVAMGSLTKQKGYSILIQCFSKLFHAYPYIQLTIYGEGPDRQQLEALIQKLDLNKYVLMPGITKMPINALLKHDVFVLSSFFEGQPNVLMEAMSIGLPCIAFDCLYGPSELINHKEDGLLIPLGDVEHLYEAMRYLVEYPEKAYKMGQKARYKIETRYKLESIIGQWELLFNSFVNNKINLTNQ